ncbi:M50 family metallopeptidase [Deinococcus cellulosilyticus]|uniref:Putative zinc metalloprotease n=1 Tax=Deinococcus cellulosilyticus (strain DSM 18568 / NBRC 106333 / KACC 11606 / 5516J-15) TaxID=1223518 RepID=A0A511N4R3_DEIC1|nr:M50 family metallopeptidase [Deinococcus cellulosilyticus]GEM47391.1 putative zinc metalloprotease [Deinococcus cellulosilyticus NBRC 106333 = KACC 11606]
MGLIIWLIVIQIAVILHEGAHYLVARMQGAKVSAFSVGMGPIIAKFKAAGTEWRLSALPIGGYVLIDDLGPESLEGQSKSRLTPWGKIAVLFAGPLSNWLLAILLMAGIFSSQGVPQTDYSKAEIHRVLPGSAAEKDGIKEGDLLVAIDGKPLPEQETVDGEPRMGYMKLQDAIRSKEPNTLTFQRGNTTYDVKLSFEWKAGARYGVEYSPKQNVKPVPNYFAALGEAWNQSIKIVPQALQSFAKGITQTFTAPLSPSSEVAGPVASAQAAGALAREGGLWGVLTFATLVNMSLAIFNLIPIPGLDGGRILLVVIQLLMRRPLQPAHEAMINFTGFVFLMVFMMLVFLGDIIRVIP